MSSPLRRIAAITLSLFSVLGCDNTPSPQSNSNGQGGQNISALLGGNGEQTQSSQFASVVKGMDITFPRDHQAHTNFRHEWWYLTANLSDENGESLGVQWTQFRFATAPANATSNKSKNSWRSEQLYMAHSAITTSKIHHADEKWSRAHPKLAGVNSHPFRVYLDDWQWLSAGEDLFPATLTAHSDQFGYALTLTSSVPYQKQGEQGYSIKSADGQVASYYYSQPFIHVSGEVTLDGKTRQVSGQGWIDREWSSQFLLDSQQGWDWFALRLSDETSLVVFQLRDSTTEQASYAHARLMQQDGTSVAISQQDIHLTPIKQTTIKGRDYPTQWQISIPTHHIELNVSALNPNAKMPLSVPYWEGPITIEGSHVGSGYMELTGY